MSAPPIPVAFSPGSGLGIVAWPTVALIELADTAIGERLWQGLVGGADGNDLIDELSVDGLRNLGSFVVAQAEGPDVRLFVRGAAKARYTGDEDSGEIDGSSVRTWVERVVSGCRSVEMAIDGPLGVDGPFRVSSGLVPAGRLWWGLPTDASAPTGEADRTSVPTTLEAPPPPTDESASTAQVGVAPPKPLDDPLDLAAEAVQASVPVQAAAPEPSDPASMATEPGSREPLPAEEDESAVARLVDSLSAPDSADTGQTLHYDALDDEGQPLSDLPSIQSTSGSDGSASTDEIEEYDYDALFGHTTHRSVQDAAVALTAEPDDEVSTEGTTGSAPESEQPVLDDSPEPVPSASGLISGIPSTSAAAEPLGVEDPGDHDGMTMTVAQLRALRASGETAGPSPVVGGGPTVQALVCGAGHANPTVLDACRQCGAPLASTQIVISRPALGRIRLSSGQTIDLTRSTIIGRNPRVEGTMHGEVPSIMKIEGIEALSRSHAIIRLEGWQVMVEDLDSANGTTVTLQGRAPRRLRAGEPIILEHGALIDFGGEVTGTYDALA